MVTAALIIGYMMELNSAEMTASKKTNKYNCISVSSDSIINFLRIESINIYYRWKAVSRHTGPQVLTTLMTVILKVKVMQIVDWRTRNLMSPLRYRPRTA